MLCCLYVLLWLLSVVLLVVVYCLAVHVLGGLCCWDDALLLSCWCLFRLLVCLRCCFCFDWIACCAVAGWFIAALFYFDFSLCLFGELVDLRLLIVLSLHAFLFLICFLFYCCCVLFPLLVDVGGTCLWLFSNSFVIAAVICLLVCLGL